MVRDMGNVMILTGVIFLSGIVLFAFTRSIVLLIPVLFTTIVIFVCFIIICRRSKYLKDPNRTPPGRKTRIS
jgi:hypothetical protein